MRLHRGSDSLLSIRVAFAIRGAVSPGSDLRCTLQVAFHALVLAWLKGQVGLAVGLLKSSS